MMIAAVVSVIAALVFIRRRTAAAPGILLAAFFIVFGTVGAQLWNWSRDTNGAGLPAEITAGSDLSSTGMSIFAAAAVGASIGAFIAAAGAPDRLSFRRLHDSISAGRIGPASQVISAAVLLLWMVGQGPSFLSRDEYLQTDGVPFLLKSFSLLGPLVGIAAFVISAFSSKRPTRGWGLVLAIVWWATTVSVGTRIAVGFTLVAIVVVVVRLAVVRTAPRFLLSLALVAVLVYANLASFAVTLIARGSPHGLLRIVSLFSRDDVPHPFDVSSWITSLKWFVSSICAAFPLTEQSALHAPPASVLIQNLNPLPSSLLNIDSYSQERLWPFFWVPLGFTGEVFGTFGALGLIVLFVLVAASAGLGAALLQRKGLDIGVLLVLTITIAAAFLSIQYPSRSAGRVISFVVFGPVLVVLALRLARFFRLESSGPENRPAAATKPLLRGVPERQPLP